MNARAPVADEVRRRRAAASFIRDAPWQVRAAGLLLGLAVALAAVTLAAGVLHAQVTPYDFLQIDLHSRLRPPSRVHWMGTDELGRDVLSRVIASTRISIFVLVAVVSVAGTTGAVVGLLAGLIGGVTDDLLMRVTDLFLAVPALFLAAAISAVFGGNIITTTFALVAVYWPWYARMTRSQVLSLRGQDFVLAAQALGASYPRLMFRTIFPLVWPVLLAQLTLDGGSVMVYTAGLSFLGLGAQPPTPEWGSMIRQSIDFQPASWWLAAFPGAALATTSFALNVLGDYLRDRADPSGAATPGSPGRDPSA